jgi:hypothetical protein
LTSLVCSCYLRILMVLSLSSHSFLLPHLLSNPLIPPLTSSIPILSLLVKALLSMEINHWLLSTDCSELVNLSSLLVELSSRYCSVSFFTTLRCSFILCLE